MVLLELNAVVQSRGPLCVADRISAKQCSARAKYLTRAVRHPTPSRVVCLTGAVPPPTGAERPERAVRRLLLYPEPHGLRSAGVYDARAWLPARV